jgi:hypothetical protein
MAVMITVSELIALDKWHELCAMRGGAGLGFTFDDEIEVSEGEAKKLGLV